MAQSVVPGVLKKPLGGVQHGWQDRGGDFAEDEPMEMRIAATTVELTIGATLQYRCDQGANDGKHAF